MFTLRLCISHFGGKNPNPAVSSLVLLDLKKTSTVLRVFRIQMNPVDSLIALMYMHKDEVNSYEETTVYGFFICM